MLCVKELCVTMLCVTMLWMAPSTTPATQSARSCHQVPRLPPKAHVHVTKCVPATQSARPCDQVPRLPRHKLRRQTHQAGLSAPPEPRVPTPATQSARGWQQVPRLRHKVNVHVTKRHACHAHEPWRQTRPSGSKHATRTIPAPRVPRLPRTVHVDGTKYRAVHVTKRHQTHDKRVQARHRSQPSAVSATPATQSARGWHQVPRLARKVHVHVSKRNACHAREPWRQMRPSAPTKPAQRRKCHTCHKESTWMSPSVWQCCGCQSCA